MKKTNNHLITPNPIIIFSTYFLMNNDDMVFVIENGTKNGLRNFDINQISQTQKKHIRE